MPEGLAKSDVENIICDLDELPLIYKFDVVAHELIKSPALHQHIDRAGVIVYEKESVFIAREGVVEAQDVLLS